ncbi:MAG: hypothetical protein Q7R79_05290 [bacterium]|nr:hypothetical protein [bacterium]
MTSNYHQKEIMIVKASGEIEPFSDAKLRRSLERVKASPDAIETIIEYVRKELKPNMSTSQIYRHPFEKLIGELLASEGFSVEVGKIVQGSCVSHEVLCKELLSKNVLRSLGLQETKITAVVNEAKQPCQKK